MKNYFYLSLLTFSSFAIGQENAQFNPLDGVLNIPYLEVGNKIYEAKLRYSDDVFVLFSGKKILSKNIGLDDISGSYDGLSDFPGIFQTDSTDVILLIDGISIEVTLDKFFSGECRLTGVITENRSSAEGEYECSDFTSGLWVSENINLNFEILFADFTFDPTEGAPFGFTVIGF
ncbi:MAG: hypothetical protein P8M72_12375 [Gammaproteobacteria bacterium]|nr:hypothetical protein [Gammaproteobacteria bacterium]